MLAFLMAKPSDLPGNFIALRMSIIAALSTYLLAGSLASGGNWIVLPALFDLGLAGVCFYAALNWWGSPERFIQAFGAYCGVTAVLNIASIVMLPAMPSGTETLDLNVIQMASYFVYLVWGITVFAHILRFTFNLTIPISIAVATSFLLMNIFLLQTLFPL